METTPCDPGNGLAGAGSDSQFVGGGDVISLDLTAQLDADSGDVLEAGAVGSPDTEGMAVNADIRLASDAAGELTELGAGEDGQHPSEGAAEAQL